MPIYKTNFMEGFTVYKCKTKDLNDVLHDSVLRAHPSYRTDSGQVLGVWYDWSIFNINGNDIPCQILLFLKITLKKLDNDAEISSTKNNYALVWMFDEEPKNTMMTTHFLYNMEKYQNVFS